MDLLRTEREQWGGVITLIPTHYKLQLQSYLMQYGDVFLNENRIAPIAHTTIENGAR